MKHNHGKGAIKDNAIKALVGSKTFRPKVEEDKTKKIPRKQKYNKPSSEGFLLPGLYNVLHLPKALLH